MTTPPIVPGNNPEPEESTQQWQQPQPVYYVQPQSLSGADVVKKSAIGTVTVILVLVGLFCVLPAVICVGLAILGQTTSYVNP